MFNPSTLFNGAYIMLGNNHNNKENNNTSGKMQLACKNMKEVLHSVKMFNRSH